MSAIWSITEFAKTKTPVVKNISFEFNSGEKVAIIGRVGCGKTTLLNAILKEAYVNEGQIQICGPEVPMVSYAEQ